MSRSAAFVLILAVANPTAWAAEAAPGAPLLGFGDEGAARQRALEARFDTFFDAGDLRGWMKQLTAHPHPLGSPWSRQNAETMAGLFRSWGYETKIESFRVLFPTPKVRVLEMTAPTSYRAVLAEPPIPQDSTSGQTSEQLPVYNAYSIDGDVTADLVYVNYGIPTDYDELARRGVDVKGKIVLARYGASWRGVKPKVAAEHGAIGCILYSDPRDDGYFQGDVYPKGGWRGEASAQRGSVADMTLFSGDPLTPGIGATGAKRLAVKGAPTITEIPTLPISYGDALPLLKALGGPMAPEAWRGALPTPYRLGPGPARVHLKLEFNWDLAPAYDVIARLPGAERADLWVIRGSHHDGWVYGAYDPVGSMVSILAEAKAVGALAKTGWRPKRTIVYAAWDGEEPGVMGSTEWAETHADELREHAAVYFNSDGNARGPCYAGGTQGLATLAYQAVRDVTDPETQASVADRVAALADLYGTPADREALRTGIYPLSPLGASSDYTVFLQHLGIAAIDMSCGGETEYGQYHSIYDSFDHYARFIDPGFVYGVVSAAAYDRAMSAAVAATAGGRTLPAETAARLDAVLRGAERALTRPEGIPGRAWYVHQVFAPGVYTGYESKTLPSIREPLEQRKWPEAAASILTVAAAIQAFAAELDRATAILNPQNSQ